MSKPPNLAGLLESFFRRRLIEQRNVSPLTVAAYRDALRLLVLYASQRAKREPCRLEVRHLGREVVLGFLEHVERDRGNGPRTRNARLTAIRSFFRHVAANDPGALAVAQQVLDIPSKRTVLQAPRHLSASAVNTLLDAPDQQTLLGRRDYALLLFLARTGARVSEAIGVDAADLRLERPPHVLLRGKGRKERLVPLAPDLARVLESLGKERGLATRSVNRSSSARGLDGSHGSALPMWFAVQYGVPPCTLPTLSDKGFHPTSFDTVWRCSCCRRARTWRLSRRG